MLHTPVYELMQRMSSREFSEWGVEMRLREEDARLSALARRAEANLKAGK